MSDVEVQKLSAEQAADLALIDGLVNDAPLAPGEVAPVAPEVQRVALAEEIAGMVLSVVAVASPALPSLKRIYTPETTRAAAESIAAVCQKHGWLNGGLMGEYSEEITCSIILLPLAVATYQGAKGDIAKLKEKAEEAKPKAAPAGPVEVVAGVASVEEVPATGGIQFGPVK